MYQVKNKLIIINYFEIVIIVYLCFIQRISQFVLNASGVKSRCNIIYNASVPISALRNFSDSATTPAVNPDELVPQNEPDKLYSRIEIEVKGIDPAVLKSYAWFATTAASHLGIEVGKK